MPKKTIHRPAYTHHKPSGQARVRLGGKDHYLGDFDSPASHDEYEKLERQRVVLAAVGLTSIESTWIGSWT